MREKQGNSQVFSADISHWKGEQDTEMWVELHLGGEFISTVFESRLVGKVKQHTDLKWSQRQNDLAACLLLKAQAMFNKVLSKKEVVKLKMRTDDVQQLVPEAVAVCQWSTLFGGGESAVLPDMRAVVDLLKEQQAQIASQQQALMQLLS